MCGSNTITKQTSCLFPYSIFQTVRVVSGVIPLYLRVKVIFPMQLLSNIDMRDIPFSFKTRSGGEIGYHSRHRAKADHLELQVRILSWPLLIFINKT